MLIKYPKTMHLPWSPGLQNDDRVIQTLSYFDQKQVIITEKLDGENATLYRDHYHARSLDSRHHPSRDWIKMFHGSIRHDIPHNLRICGENMYAEHSIRYEDLETYFYGFSVWDSDNFCLSWDETLELFHLLGITPVPELWSGTFNEVPWDTMEQYASRDGVEGYVIRTTDRFHYDDFAKYVAKYVRKDHVQTDQHWMQKPVTPNGLRQ